MTTINLDKLKEIMKQNPGRKAKIKIVSVGGAGANAVNFMITSGMQDVEFIITDCHADTFLFTKAKNRILLGENLRKGLPAISDPEIGQKAAEEARDVLIENLRGADTVYIVAAMGGGTGTGASPIVAECAKEVGALVVGVVTKPFLFEGKRRMAQAEAGIVKLKEHVDVLVTISDQCLLQYKSARKFSMLDAFNYSDEIICRSVQAMLGIIAVSGLVQIDIKE